MTQRHHAKRYGLSFPYRVCRSVHQTRNLESIGVHVGQRMDRELQSAIYQRRELRYPPLSFIIEHTSATVEVVFGKGFPSYSDIIIQLLSEPAGCIGTNRSTINCSMGTVLAASPLEITATFFGANVVNNPCRRYCNFPRPFNDPLPD